MPVRVEPSAVEAAPAPSDSADQATSEAHASLGFQNTDDRSPGRARRWVRHELENHQVPPHVVDDAELVVSELVANSAGHVGGRVTVSVSILSDGVGIAVHDDGTSLFRPTSSDEHGRGLTTAERMTTGVVVDQYADTGTTVRALAPITEDLTGVSRGGPPLRPERRQT